MTISLQTLVVGDTGYIVKHNSNYSVVKQAIDALQASLGNTAQANLTAPLGFESLFGTSDVRIGGGSYVASTNDGTDLFTVTAGYAWVSGIKAVVNSAASQTVSFVGSSAGTYYIHINSAGSIYKDQLATAAHYSVYYDGAAFSALTTLIGAVWTPAEIAVAASSSALGATYTTLDARLEAGETKAVNGDGVATAIKTRTSKSVAGGANVTLTAGEAAAVNFVLTGLLTASISVLLPLSGAVPRLLTVTNNTTGDFEINFKGSTQSGGVNVPQGYSMVLNHDGTNVANADTSAYVIAKTIPYAATITLDWSKYDTAHITLTGDATITHTNARPGQKCLLYIAQDATGGRLVTWTAEVAYGSDIGGISLSSTPSKTDEIGFSYNWVASKYNVVSIAKGY